MSGHSMPSAAETLAAFREAGFRLFTGVPCSFLTPLIDAVLASDDLDHIGAANEGDAVAIACGSEIGGRPAVCMLQNSGLGNALNPLTSLAATFRLPLLFVSTWRGDPAGPPDEPQHELMGRITPALLELLGIPWEPFPAAAGELHAALGRARAHMRRSSTPYAFLVRKDTIEKGARPALDLSHPPAEPARVEGAFPPRGGRFDPDDALRAVLEVSGDAVVVATTGFTGRALYALADRPNHFYMVGSMGCASSLALGLARARPERRVVVLDGDGALLMRMGALATVGREQPRNLVHVLLDNAVHDSTGSQATVSTRVDLSGVAAACRYPEVRRCASLAELGSAIREARTLSFLHVLTLPRTARKLPRPTIGPAEVAARLREWLRTST